MSVLYGARGGNLTTSDLYRIDPLTGTASSVGAIGFAVTGLAWDATTSTMYGVTSNNSAASPRNLITVNLATGAGTVVGALGGSLSMGDITCDSDGNLYGLASTAPPGSQGLYGINKSTGAATYLGTDLGYNAGGAGLACDGSGVLFAFPDGNIYTLGVGSLYAGNKDTGAMNVVWPLSGYSPGTGNMSAATFDSDGVLYATDNVSGGTPTVLVTVDVDTGVVTSVGTTTAKMDALAWDAAPGAPLMGVCIAPDDSWAEVDPTWVRLDDPDEDWRLRVNQVTIDRGKSNELDTTKTGTCTVTFKDPDGILDPTNTTSQFYDTGNSVTKLNPNVQVIVRRRNPVTGVWYTRFRGFTKQWTYDMDTSGFSTVKLEAVDLFELLADLEMTPGDQGDTAPQGFEGDIYFEGGSTIGAESVFKHVDDRQVEALTDAGIPTEWMDIFSGNVSVQAQKAERYTQLLEVLFAAADAEFPGVANIYISKEGIYRFRGRYARFFPERPGYGIGEWAIGGAAQAAADATVVRLQSFTFHRSKEDIFNKALALPQGLVDGDVPGQMVTDATSIAKYGIRPWVGEELLTWHGHNDDLTETTAAEETLKFATYRVDNYKEPKNRIEQIVVRMLRPDHFSGPAVWDFLCGVEIGDVLDVDTTHRGGGGFNERYFVEGLREVEEKLDGTMNNVTVIVDVSPESFFDSNPFGEVDDGNPES